MDLQDMGDQELETLWQHEKTTVAIYSERLKMMEDIIREHEDIVHAARNIIFKRRIENIIEKSFDEQLAYFVQKHDDESLGHYRARERFFEKLGIKMRGNAFVFVAHPDFVRTNFTAIQLYLHTVLTSHESSLCIDAHVHTMTVQANRNIDRISYFVETDSYTTDGIYLRQFRTLKEVLNYMLED